MPEQGKETNPPKIGKGIEGRAVVVNAIIIRDAFVNRTAAALQRRRAVLASALETLDCATVRSSKPTCTKGLRWQPANDLQNVTKTHELLPPERSARICMPARTRCGLSD